MLVQSVGDLEFGQQVCDCYFEKATLQFSSNSMLAVKKFGALLVHVALWTFYEK